jgi:hypothetical protein
MMPEEHLDGPLVTVFSSRRHDAETEAEVIHGLLESAGIDAIIVRENVQELPAGKIWVKVVASSKDDAEQVIRDAQDIGDAEIEEADSESGAGMPE